jgi:predicted homoserine dehydrogenase-like protein
MVIVINSTGYDYDAPQLHAPIARIIEMPEIMCGRGEGGILKKDGFRQPDPLLYGGRQQLETHR